MTRDTITRQEFIEILEDKSEFIVIKKCSDPQKNVEELLKFIKSVELSRNDIEDLAFHSNVIDNVLASAKAFINGDSLNKEVISMNKFREYRMNMENLMEVLNDILPYNYYIAEENNKVLAKKIMPTWEGI